MSFNAGARHLVRVRARQSALGQFRNGIQPRLPLISTASTPPRIAFPRSSPAYSKYNYYSTTSSRAANSEKKSSPSPNEEPGPLSDPLNPPASTRPPPLDTPVRDPSVNLFVYLFRLGKAYTTFYKTGLKAVFTNRRLVRDLPDTPPPGFSTARSSAELDAPPTTSGNPALINKSASPTRAALLLRARVRHDTARLPLFGLIVLICGEFTPLIVLLFPRLTPYTCRIPTQATVIRKSVESRRAASVRALQHIDPAALDRVADGHICRSLSLGSTLWDRMGFDVPFAQSRAAEAVARIVRDDAFLREASKGSSGVRALVDDEVVLACEERGIDTLKKDVATLREKLEDWIAKSAPSSQTAKEGGNNDAALKEATEKIRSLLLGRGESL